MIPGGDTYPGLIRKNPIRPMRIFLQDGANDLNNIHGSWFLANQQMLSAMQWANATADASNDAAVKAGPRYDVRNSNGATAPIPTPMAAGCCRAFCGGCLGETRPRVARAKSVQWTISSVERREHKRAAGPAVQPALKQKARCHHRAFSFDLAGSYGFTNRSVMRSLSPMASYLARS